MGGVSSSNSVTKSNEILINQYINPMSGLINLSVDGVVYFKKNEKITKTGFLYQLGERVLTGYKVGLLTDPQTGNPTNFLNTFSSVGLYFQTGAWERTNSKNVGVFWTAFRYIGCYTNPTQIKKFLPDIETNGIYHGYSFGFGVEINNLINIKAIYYKYIKKPEIDYNISIYQFTFNYSLKN